MNYEQAKEALKGNLRDYLDRQGITPNREGKILCINPEHPDHSPSMQVYPDRVKCFSCGRSYDLMDCIGILEGIPTFSGQLHRAADLYGIILDEPTATATPQGREIQEGETIPDPRGAESITTTAPAHPQPEPLPNIEGSFKQWSYNLDASPEAKKYLEERGLSFETCFTYLLGYEPAWKASGNRGTWQAITIPTSTTTVSVRNMDREADHKSRYDMTPGAQKNLYPWGYIHEQRLLNRPAIVCEGYFDALAIIQSGGNAVAIEGTGDRAIVSFLQDPKNRNGRPVIIALDNDKPGKEGAAQLEKDLATVAGLQVYQVNIAGSYKDPAERLQEDPAGLAEAVEYCNSIEENKRREAAEKYRKEQSATGRMQAFHKIIATNKNGARISTGFSNIDKALDGGIYPGLYCLGAVSSLGKTTMLLELADNIARGGRDVLFFTLEMGEGELMAKSISRHTFEISRARNMPAKYARTTRDILMDRADSQTSRALIEDAEAEYLKYSDRLFFVEGVMDYGPIEVRERIRQHMNITGAAPVAILDYLQILTPTDVHQTDKQKTDEAVKILKQTSREFNTPIICISSFNRDNYTGPVNMTAFKESGAIEYSSDVLLGLQYRGIERKIIEKDGKKKWENKDEYEIRIHELTDPERIKERLKNGQALEIEMKILKERTGTKGKVTMDFFPQFNLFEDHKDGPISEDATIFM